MAIQYQQLKRWRLHRMANPGGTPENLKPFKAKWSTGETKVIRVPAYLADRVLRYAHEIDSRKDKRDRHTLTGDDVRSLLQVVDELRKVLDFPRNSFNKMRKAFLKSQIDRLLELIPTGPADLNSANSTQGNQAD